MYHVRRARFLSFLSHFLAIPHTAVLTECKSDRVPIFPHWSPSWRLWCFVASMPCFQLWLEGSSSELGTRVMSDSWQLLTAHAAPTTRHFTFLPVAGFCSIPGQGSQSCLKCCPLSEALRLTSSACTAPEPLGTQIIELVVLLSWHQSKIKRPREEKMYDFKVTKALPANRDCVWCLGRDDKFFKTCNGVSAPEFSFQS